MILRYVRIRRALRTAQRANHALRVVADVWEQLAREYAPGGSYRAARKLADAELGRLKEGGHDVPNVREAPRGTRNVL